MRIFKRDKRSCGALLCLALFALSASLWGDCTAGLAAVSSKDYATALKEFTASAGQGDSCSQFNLGAMYFQGNGVPQDYNEAVKWYRLAADQGDAEAQYSLGVIYGEGQGVPQDYKEALKWFRLAADQGLSEAQFNLGIMYGRGTAFPRISRRLSNGIASRPIKATRTLNTTLASCMNMVMVSRRIMFRPTCGTAW